MSPATYLSKYWAQLGQLRLRLRLSFGAHAQALGKSSWAELSAQAKAKAQPQAQAQAYNPCHTFTPNPLIASPWTNQCKFSMNMNNQASKLLAQITILNKKLRRWSFSCLVMRTNWLFQHLTTPICFPVRLRSACLYFIKSELNVTTANWSNV